MSGRSKKPRRGTRRLHAVRSPTAELARLLGPFLAWLAGAGLSADVDTDALWHDLDAAVALAADRAGLANPCAWTAERIEALAGAAGNDAIPLVSAAALLLDFLAETGRWAGTPAELEEAVRAAEETASPVAAIVAELVEVTVDPAVEDAALRALPVVGRAEQLLRLVTPRRPVTGTGALRRADLAAAAELVEAGLQGRTPRSMWDVPRLADLWSALEDSGLLAISTTEARPTPPAAAWLAGDEEEGRRCRRLAAAGYLAELLTCPSAAPWLPHPSIGLLPVLSAAALGQPVPADEAFSDPGGLLEGPIAELMAEPANALLHRLADEGFVEVSEAIVAVPGLRGLLAGATAALLRAGLEGDEEPDLPDPDPDLAGHAWRLRIELEGADPPVWREVLVDPGIPLDRLHQVIQGLFAWEDYHLHEFSVPGRGGQPRRYALPHPEDLEFGDPPADERRVRLSQLVGPRRGRLRYRYDFGDSWDHRITVVGTEPAPAGALPRCTGGSGAAPHEDSGGVWGWSEMVAAARDPRHPEHADVRDWLGLADGETLDPTAFDPAAADERLARLR